MPGPRPAELRADDEQAHAARRHLHNEPGCALSAKREDALSSRPCRAPTWGGCERRDPEPDTCCESHTRSPIRAGGKAEAEKGETGRDGGGRHPDELLDDKELL